MTTTADAAATETEAPPAPPAEESAHAQAEEVSVELGMSRQEFDALLRAAAEAGLAPREFLLEAIEDKAFLEKNRRKGNRILIQTRRGLRELVD